VIASLLTRTCSGHRYRAAAEPPDRRGRPSIARARRKTARAHHVPDSREEDVNWLRVALMAWTILVGGSGAFWVFQTLRAKVSWSPARASAEPS
jgi:hypothetical protein